MPNLSSLKILLDHAQKQSDASAKQLGQLNLQQREAEKKLHLLLEYRQHYQTHFQDSAKKGLDQIEWLNFIAFMNKLDAAITEQRKSVTDVNTNRETSGSEFLSHQRKLKSYNTLSQRLQRANNQQQIKHEQKDQDEYALNMLIRNQLISRND